MQELELDLDVYQGPFDLLFTLILKEEVDIFEVPLLEIILAYLEKSVSLETPGIDWEGLSEFIVLISSLLELKSRVLLPGVERADEMGSEEARDLLLARLLAYQKFKAAAEVLRARGQQQRGRLLRAPSRERRRALPPLSQVQRNRDPEELQRPLIRLLELRKAPDTSHVAVVRVEVLRQVNRIKELLRGGGRFSFDRAFGSEPPVVQAVTLFVLMELLARGEVKLSQLHPFGDIRVRALEARQIA